jgi:hypothetical protein
MKKQTTLKEGLLRLLESFQFSNLTPEEQKTLYLAFEDAYTKATGGAWEEDRFLSRAHAWTFYGDISGGIAVRKQRSGLLKLVATYGDPMKIARGFKQFIQEEQGKPVWGAMTLNLVEMLERFSKGDFKRAPAFLVKFLKPFVQRIFGDEIQGVNSNGALIVDVQGIGTFEKYMIGNRAYYEWLITSGLKQNNVPDIIATKIKKQLIDYLS